MWFPVLCFYTERKWEASSEGQTKQSLLFTASRRQTLKEEGCGRLKHSSHCVDGLSIFIKPTRHRVRRSLLKKCCSQMDGLSQIYLLQSSFLVDYSTASQHELNSLALSLLPACLAQGESDVGQREDTVLSMTSSEIQSRYQKLI